MGERLNPTVNVLEKITKVLGASVDDLIQK
jgi:hypothetical protein